MGKLGGDGKMVDRVPVARFLRQLPKADKLGPSFCMLTSPAAARRLTAEALDCAEDDARVDDALENVWETISKEDAP